MAAQPDPDLLKRIRAIQACPLLTEEEELRLARAWRDHGSKSAQRRIIRAHQRISVAVARKFTGYGVDLGELISEGDLGLTDALNRFDPERGFRFSTYATYWVTAAIRTYTMSNWSMVVLKSTTNRRKLFFQLRRVMRELSIHDHGKGLLPDQLALLSTTLDVPASDIEEMLLRFRTTDFSLDTPKGEDSDTSWLETMTDGSVSIEETYDNDRVLQDHRATLLRAIESLSSREKDIFSGRFLQEPAATLEELGETHGVSRERIRQIATKAFDKVKKVVLNIQHEQAMDRQAAFADFRARGALESGFATPAAMTAEHPCKILPDRGRGKAMLSPGFAPSLASQGRSSREILLKTNTCETV